MSCTHRRLLASRDQIMARQIGERHEGFSEVSDAPTLQSPSQAQSQATGGGTTATSKAVSFVPSEHSVASHYWKLDAERTHFQRELCSRAAVRDTVRFFFWLCIGNPESGEPIDQVASSQCTWPDSNSSSKHLAAQSSSP